MADTPVWADKPSVFLQGSDLDFADQALQQVREACYKRDYSQSGVPNNNAELDAKSLNLLSTLSADCLKNNAARPGSLDNLQGVQMMNYFLRQSALNHYNELYVVIADGQGSRVNLPVMQNYLSGRDINSQPITDKTGKLQAIKLSW